MKTRTMFFRFRVYTRNAAEGWMLPTERAEQTIDAMEDKGWSVRLMLLFDSPNDSIAVVFEKDD